MKRKAIITSIKSFKLSNKEANLIYREKPWGIILFKRNIKSFIQLKNLIANIKNIMKDDNYPIMIDEEGGNVSRLADIFNNHAPQKFFGDIYKIDKKISIKIYQLYIDRLTSYLKELGININTVPVLDVVRHFTNKIIGSRSFSSDKLIVKELGQECLKRYKLNKIGTVIKHIPGHGASMLDSHLVESKVNIEYRNLAKIDFFPFTIKNSKFAMTAHIIYTRIDKKNVATFSKKIISKIIRNKIGFKGILISDDISMKALKYDLITNAKKSLEAGCNLVLYCSGNYLESKKLIKNIPYIDKFTAKKTSEFYKFLR